MLRLALRRGLAAIPVLFVVVLVSFALVELMPGNPAEVVAGEQATAQQVREAAVRLGLDKPLLSRFGDYVGGVVTGDLGTSFRTSRPVADTIDEALPVTVSLVLVATVMALLIAVPAGMYAAMARGGVVDRLVTSLSALGLAIPPFVFAFPLVVFLAIDRGWFPATGYTSIADGGPWDWLRQLVLPGFALAVGSAAELARQIRGAMIDTLEQDYIRTVRAMGLARRSVVWKHALKNSSIPVVTILGLQAGRLLGGSVIVETVFAMPGFGSLAYTSVIQQDLPLIQGVVIVSAVIVLVVNLLTDMSYLALNPRLRH